MYLIERSERKTTANSALALFGHLSKIVIGVFKLHLSLADKFNFQKPKQRQCANRYKPF
jgi:hypothetical protein